MEMRHHVSFLREKVPISGEAVRFASARNMSTVELYTSQPRRVAASLQPLEWEEVIFKITDGSGLGMGL
jgi:hypothetical protein